METNEKQLTEQESFEIIQSMITVAKSEAKADSFIFLLWGWLVFIASIAQFILAEMNSEYNSTPWLLMPVGGVITVIYFIRKRKSEKVKTHVSDFIRYIWTAFGAAMIVIMFFNSMNFMQVLPVIMCLYGIGLFLTGGAFKFKPLIWGGVFCWLCAIAGFEVQNLYLLLILALAVLGGYIIPGYMLNRKNKTQHV